MALKHGSSSGIGLVDLVHSWAAFEQINQVKVACQVAYEVLDGKWALQIRAEAWAKDPVSGEARCLVSESVRCSATDWQSLDTALFRLLYALDAALAFREMGGKRKSA